MTEANRVTEASEQSETERDRLAFRKPFSSLLRSRCASATYYAVSLDDMPSVQIDHDQKHESKHDTKGEVKL